MVEIFRNLLQYSHEFIFGMKRFEEEIIPLLKANTKINEDQLFIGVKLLKEISELSK